MVFASKEAENGYDIMKKQSINSAMRIRKFDCNVLTMTEEAALCRNDFTSE